MRACAYCGLQNDYALLNCSTCGCELTAEPVETAQAQRLCSRSNFFRWMPTAIVLWTYGVISAVSAGLSGHLAILVARNSIRIEHLGDSRRVEYILLRGVVEHASIAAFCVLGWYLMRRRTPDAFLWGTAVVLFALLMTLRRWIYWQVAGANPGSWIEPLFVWPCLAYAIIYSYG